MPFSARVFDARYFTIFGASTPCSSTILTDSSPQFVSLNVVVPSPSFAIMAAPEEVITIRESTSLKLEV